MILPPPWLLFASFLLLALHRAGLIIENAGARPACLLPIISRHTSSSQGKDEKP